MTRITPDVARLPVLDENARPLPLGALWATAPAVLVFLRHFG